MFNSAIFFFSFSAFRNPESLNLIGLGCVAAVSFPLGGEIDLAREGGARLG